MIRTVQELKIKNWDKRQVLLSVSITVDYIYMLCEHWVGKDRVSTSETFLDYSLNGQFLIVKDCNHGYTQIPPAGKLTSRMPYKI